MQTIYLPGRQIMIRYCQRKKKFVAYFSIDPKGKVIAKTAKNAVAALIRKYTKVAVETAEREGINSRG